MLSRQQLNEINELIQMVVKKPSDRTGPDIKYMSKWMQENAKSVEDEETIREMCKSMTHEQIPAGSVLFQQGDLGSKYYIVLAGSISVSVNSITVNVLGPGQCFGEQALLRSDHERQATCAGTFERAHIELGVMDEALFNRCLRDQISAEQWIIEKEYELQVARASRASKGVGGSGSTQPVSTAKAAGGLYMMRRQKVSLQKMLRRIYHAVRFILRMDSILFENKGRRIWHDFWEHTELESRGFFIEPGQWSDKALKPPQRGLGEIRMLQDLTAQQRLQLRPGIPSRLMSKVNYITSIPLGSRSEQQVKLLVRFIYTHWPGQSDLSTRLPSHLAAYMACHMKKRTAAAGEVVLQEGGTNTLCFFVLKGAVRVSVSGSAEVAVITAGESFGEAALLSGGAGKGKLHQTHCKQYTSVTVASPVGAEFIVISHLSYSHCFSGIQRHHLRRKVRFLEDLPCMKRVPKPKLTRIAYATKTREVPEQTTIAIPPPTPAGTPVATDLVDDMGNPVEAPSQRAYFLMMGEAKAVVMRRKDVPTEQSAALSTSTSSYHKFSPPSSLVVLLTPGMLFGELGFLTSERSLSIVRVITTKKSTVLEISEASYQKFVQEDEVCEAQLQRAATDQLSSMVGRYKMQSHLRPLRSPMHAKDKDKGKGKGEGKGKGKGEGKGKGKSAQARWLDESKGKPTLVIQTDVSNSSGSGSGGRSGGAVNSSSTTGASRSNNTFPGTKKKLAKPPAASPTRRSPRCQSWIKGLDPVRMPRKTDTGAGIGEGRSNNKDTSKFLLTDTSCYGSTRDLDGFTTGSLSARQSVDPYRPSTHAGQGTKWVLDSSRYDPESTQKMPPLDLESTLQLNAKGKVESSRRLRYKRQLIMRFAGMLHGQKQQSVQMTQVQSNFPATFRTMDLPSGHS